MPLSYITHCCYKCWTFTFHPSLIWCNGGTLDANIVLQDSICCIYCNLIICSITMGKTQIVVQTFNLGDTEKNNDSKWKKQSLYQYWHHENLCTCFMSCYTSLPGGGGGGRGGVAVCCSLIAGVSYLNIWKYELLLDHRPNDASHLITVHLDNGILGHNTLCCIWKRHSHGYQAQVCVITCTCVQMLRHPLLWDIIQHRWVATLKEIIWLESLLNINNSTPE